MPKRVIIIDDDPTSMVLYKRFLRDACGLQIVGEFEKAEDALLQILFLEPDVAIVDYKLPGISGIDFARLAQNQYPKIKVILATGHDPEYLSTPLCAMPNIDFVQKTWSKQDVSRIIELCN